MPQLDANDAGQMHAEIGAENWDQMPTKGWKKEKKLHQVLATGPSSRLGCSKKTWESS